MTSIDNGTVGVSHALVPSSDRQRILERLFVRCDIRRQIGVRPFKVRDFYRKQVMSMAHEKYETMLAPYLMDAFRSVDWPAGFTPRLLLAVKLHKHAVVQLQSDLGIDDPRTKMPDMVAMMDRFIRTE